jgi:hypothetical protein
LAAMVLAPLKLRCCDIDTGRRLKGYNGKRAGTLSVDPNISNGDHGLYSFTVGW